MGRRYEQFSLEQRCTLSQLSQAGKTVRQIAAAMDRAPSTIARELKRNSGAQVGYQPAWPSSRLKAVAGEVVDCCVSPIFNKQCSKVWHKVGRRLKLPDA
jgi:hypothetical protein